MIGSLFAGTDESPGEKILYGGRMYKSYRGMGSEAVLNNGGDRYGSKAVPEGIEGRVPHKGPLTLVFEQLVGGLRQGMGYAGCSSITELRKNATFVRVSFAGNRESHTHGVAITKQPPNYQIEQ
jgi:IMP dehydrogenase